MLASLGNVTKTAVTYLDDYWVQILGSMPVAFNAADVNYNDDPKMLPGILAPGGFADFAAAVRGTSIQNTGFESRLRHCKKIHSSKHAFNTQTLTENKR